jgi:uncharacterized protein (TIGR00661 family)
VIHFQELYFSTGKMKYFYRVQGWNSQMKNVLICPLDWGIGHATRIVPVIRKFLENGFHVVIAADGRPLEFLCREFPTLRHIRFPGVRISYHNKTSLSLVLFMLIPKYILGLIREHRFLKKLLRREKFDVIVSDNRYGLWQKNKHTILLTHQLSIILPHQISFLTGLVNSINKRLISSFSECWIPDFELHNGLAGRLSHPPELPSRHRYIGSLSRFSFNQGEAGEQVPYIYDLLVMLSGPEPQRSIFEEKILAQLKSTKLKGIVIRGMTESTGAYDLTDTIRVYSHLETGLLKKAMQAASLVVCRSGYSSIMDIVAIGKQAILVPTPGQTEQEYLARYMMDKKIYFSIPQKHFDLVYAMELVKNFPGMQMQNDYRILEERIRELQFL